jgi:hypothetical protein
MGPSQSFLQFRAGALTAWRSWQLRRPKPASAEQARALARLLEPLSRSAYGRERKIRPGMSYAEFRTAAPLSTIDSLGPYIGRMLKGEADVLWPGQCPWFTSSANELLRPATRLPVTTASLQNLRRAGLEALLLYTTQVGHVGALRGRHLIHAGSSALHSISTPKGELAVGRFAAMAHLAMPAWAERRFLEPPASIAAMPDGPDRLQAVAEATRHRDITLLAGPASNLLELATCLRSLSGAGEDRNWSLQSLWPNLECVIHWGMPIAPHEQELRAFAGPEARLHEVYCSAGNLLAAQDNAGSEGLRLFTGLGVFFEFVPAREARSGDLESASAQAVSLEQAEPGVDYALAITTSAGLCRFLVGDVVRLLPGEPKRLLYVGRLGHLLSCFGERLKDRDVCQALAAVCRRQDWQVARFHVAPFTSSNDPLRRRARHEWWIELRTPSRITPISGDIAAALDQQLKELSPRYAAKRLSDGLEPPLVRLVASTVFDEWLQRRHLPLCDVSIPRVLPDRSIADELGDVARFHHDL